MDIAVTIFKSRPGVEVEVRFSKTGFEERVFAHYAALSAAKHNVFTERRLTVDNTTTIRHRSFATNPEKKMRLHSTKFDDYKLVTSLEVKMSRISLQRLNGCVSRNVDRQSVMITPNLMLELTNGMLELEMVALSEDLLDRAEDIMERVRGCTFFLVNEIPLKKPSKSAILSIECFFDYYRMRKPITLHQKNYSALVHAYHMSPKYDGERVFVIFLNGFFYYKKLTKKAILLGPCVYAGFKLFDCERVGDVFYVMTTLDMDERTDDADILRQILKYDTRPKPLVKFNSVSDILRDLPTDVPCDGVIISTPDKDFKFKRVHTFDLRIEEDGLYTSDGLHMPHTQDFSIDKVIGMIAEFQLVNKKPEFVRLRPDKPSPNSYDIVVQNTTMPITVEQLQGYGALMFRYHSNQQKNDLLYTVTGQKGLDIGTGQGGDLQKWKKCNLEMIGVEPDADQIKEAKRRGMTNIIHATLETLSDNLLGNKVSFISLFFCWNLLGPGDVANLERIVAKHKPRRIIGIYQFKASNAHNKTFSMKVIDETTYEIEIFGTRVGKRVERLHELPFEQWGYKPRKVDFSTTHYPMHANERLLMTHYQSFSYTKDF